MKQRFGDISKDWLEEHYLRKKESTRRIAKTLNVSGKTISRWLKQYGISARPFSHRKEKETEIALAWKIIMRGADATDEEVTFALDVLCSQLPKEEEARPPQKNPMNAYPSPPEGHRYGVKEEMRRIQLAFGEEPLD